MATLQRSNRRHRRGSSSGPRIPCPRFVYNYILYKYLHISTKLSVCRVVMKTCKMAFV
jgi:hypothetical protein